jgi:hypothetical protein
MIFLIRYIYKLIVRNPGKLIFLSAGLIALYINMNYITQNYTYTERVLTQFEVHGQKYIVIEDDGKTDNFRTEKLTNEYAFNDNGEIVKTGTEGWFIGLWVISGVCWAIVLFAPLESSCAWEFDEIYDECRIRNVKVDREGTKLYYHYKGRILKVFDTGDTEMYNGKGLSRSEVARLIHEFKKSPNLYEKYIGTKSKIREGKIDKLFPVE